MSHAGSGRSQRTRRAPDRHSDASSDDECTTGRPTAAERDEALLIIDAMQVLRLLRDLDLVIRPAQIALALAWIRDDQTLRNLNFKRCCELFGVAEEGKNLHARWVMDWAGRIDAALFYLAQSAERRAALRLAPQPAVDHGAAAAAGSSGAFGAAAGRGGDAG